jgi:hypothetical protein
MNWWALGFGGVLLGMGVGVHLVRDGGFDDFWFSIASKVLLGAGAMVVVAAVLAP